MRTEVIARGSRCLGRAEAHSGVSILHSSLQALTLTHRAVPGGMYTQKSLASPVMRVCTEAADTATESPWVCVSAGKALSLLDGLGNLLRLMAETQNAGGSGGTCTLNTHPVLLQQRPENVSFCIL